MPRRVEEQHRHLDGRDAVDQRVVRLPDHRPASLAQPAHDIDPPQRMARLERLREQRPGEVPQLARAGGRRERHRVHVVGDSDGGRPATRIVQPMCRGACGLSRSRKAASSPLRRSIVGTLA
jgi:hypothetical protein